jgi:RNA polymerase sigma factor (sigma-70 family)
MNRVLMILRGPLADVATATDQDLLDRFLTARDESAFAELVRRYGPVVWGACRRRLANVQDAEDAFQAAFLVLLRRAARLDGTAPLGPWLYKVAVMTASNVVRGNRRRAAITGPMEHEIPATGREPADHLDLDAALLALPERDRVPVVLCHLLGLSRREAAERLGCPEGTLSARLNRALRRLRARLGGAVPVALGAGAVAVPAGLASATVRSAAIYSTSTSTAAGVSPAVVGLTDGVIRMFWMKKVVTAAVLAVLVIGGALALGTLNRSDSVVAAEPNAGAKPPAREEDELKRIEKQLADLQKQKEDIDAKLSDLSGEKAKLENEKKERDEKAAAEELGKDIEVAVGQNDWPRPYLVREVVNGKVAEMTCSSLDLLKVYLTRAHNDSKGPQKLRISADRNQSMDELRKVFAVCVAAGYTKATFGLVDRLTIATHRTVTGTFLAYDLHYKTTFKEMLPDPGVIDLKKLAEPKKQP